MDLDDFPVAMGEQMDAGVGVFDLQTLAETGSLVRGRAYRAPCYLLILITEGQGQHQIDSDAWSYQAGTLFPVVVGQIQRLDWLPETAGYQIMFADQYCACHSSDLSWFYGMRLFDPTRKIPVLHLSAPVYRMVSWITQRLQGLVPSETDTLGRQLQWHLLKTLLLEMENEIAGYEHCPARGDGEAALYGRFREQLERDFHHCRSVRMYAKSMHTTPKKLNQVIQGQVGQSAKQVIDERVVAEIRRLLIHTDLTIQEIGYRLGFAEAGNLIKFFKRHISCTPAQYKSANRPRAHSYYHSADCDLLSSGAVADKHNSVRGQCERENL